MDDPLGYLYSFSNTTNSIIIHQLSCFYIIEHVDIIHSKQVLRKTNISMIFRGYTMLDLAYVLDLQRRSEPDGSSLLLDARFKVKCQLLCNHQF